MRKIMYLFLFAIVMLVLKAFIFDEYIERYTTKETNTTDLNTSAEAVQSAPKPQTIESDANTSDTSESDLEKNISSEKEKMPLEKLGDEFSKHINL